MITEFGDTQEIGHKFDSPMAVYLYYCELLNGNEGDETASDHLGGWANRYGRRILMGDDYGRVTYARYDTPDEAAFDFERLAAQINGWLIVRICTDCLILAANGPDEDHPQIDQPGLGENDDLVPSAYDTEPSFSWSPCYACQRPEGGDRYIAFVKTIEED